MVIGGHPIPNSLKFFLITIELKSYLRTNILIASPHLLIQMCKIPKLQHVVNSPSSFFSSSENSQVSSEEGKLRENLILNLSFFG